MKILVVDDNRELVDKLTNVLRNENYIVAQAYNGVSAIEYVNNNPCDLILMDIDLPLLDGISALKEINKTRNIPVILMSEKTEENDVLLGYESGCIDYIRKPLFIKEIVYKVNNYLGKNSKELFDFDNLVIDCIARKVLIDNKEVEMTNKEYQLLVYFLLSYLQGHQLQALPYLLYPILTPPFYISI